MAKTSKIVSQKETPSTSRPATKAEETVSRAAIDEPVPEPPLKMFIPGGMLGQRRFQGLSKDVELRPPTGGEDLPAESPAPRQAKEKKIKRALSSPSSEKKKTRRRLVRKSKERTSARAPSSDSLYRLRDKSKEEEEPYVHVARVPSQLERQGASELENHETDLPQTKEVDEEAGAAASRDEGNAPKEALGVIDITELPSFTKSMYNEAQTASVLHHETFLRYRDELNQLEAEVKGLIEKRYTYKLLSEQREGEAKSLRAELEVARKEHADLVEQVKIFEVSDDELDTVTNGRNPQVQQNIDRID
ncbi:uncharacterized protein [Nicotiana tomentosiformis]|uniref:uncharacterized protein n=1 Tax=Nicotiana tomentosiformis TaxID=4098 RepID=UPI00388C5CBB